jgi:L-ascorbate metabolism protein UlaG (beta-lactamase superfamily)
VAEGLPRVIETAVALASQADVAGQRDGTILIPQRRPEAVPVADQLVRNYHRPVSLGGPEHPDPDVVSLRWFGTATFELAFGDQVVLLDNFYERPARNRPLGFGVAEVNRADLILVGHPHYDHVADTVRVATQTGAPVAIAPIGADYLVGQGLSAGQIHSVPGLGDGDVLYGSGFTVRALHGYHLDIGLNAAQIEKWEALRAARAAFEAEFVPPPTPEEDQAAAQIAQRGVHTPEVNTQATLTYVIDIDGFRIAYRDSGGAISDEERAYFTAHPGVDVAILSINGLPHVAQQLEDVFLPLAELYQPRVLVPSHHDELWANFDGTGLTRLFADVATEPVKERVHDELPETITVQPGLAEPLTVSRSKGDVTLGQLHLQ